MDGLEFWAPPPMLMLLMAISDRGMQRIALSKTNHLNKILPVSMWV